MTSAISPAAAALHRQLTQAEEEQREAALEHAQTVRLAGAAVKDAVHMDPSWDTLVDILTGDLDLAHAGAVRVGLLLTSAAGIGPTKAGKMLAEARIGSPRRRLDALSVRQRMALAAEVRRGRRNLSDSALERFSKTRRHYYQRAQ
jgi:hypothetical protein